MNHRAHILTALSFLQIKSKMIISKKMFEAGRPMLEKVLHDLNVAENEGAPPAPVLNPIMSDARLSMRRHKSALEKAKSSSTKAIGNAARQEGEGAARVARTRSSSAGPAQAAAKRAKTSAAAKTAKKK
jgi:hypothetical protein